MREKKVFVYVDLNGSLFLVGQLWSRSMRGKEGASFQYDQAWLNHKERFALEPALHLTEGAFHTDQNRNMFGAIGDSAPDRWGRILMRRAESHRCRELNEKPNTLTEIDYLLGVSDEARQGALRFSEAIGGPFLQNSNSHPIPPLIQLPKLLSASENLLQDRESDEDLRLLLAPGSSLGGARPKASVRDADGSLAIAKFSRSDDEYPTILWEAVALKLAALAGLQTPEWYIKYILKKPTLILKRFDRNFDKRIPFLSALSMIGGKDNEFHSYLEVADAIRHYGAYPLRDLKELWKRIVFNILISNFDDHLRNLGFLYERSKGWTLSPAYDLNPTPIEVKPRYLTTAIDENDTKASLSLALLCAQDYGLELQEAKKIAKGVAEAVKNWHREAKSLKLKGNDIDRMSSAFNHDDLNNASSL